MVKEYTFDANAYQSTTRILGSLANGRDPSYIQLQTLKAFYNNCMVALATGKAFPGKDVSATFQQVKEVVEAYEDRQRKRVHVIDPVDSDLVSMAFG